MSDNRSFSERDHELELEKIRHPESPWAEWARTARVVMIWLLVLAAVCYLASIDAL